jgi:biopolymer transport protein TolR
MNTAFPRRKSKRKLKSDINVVPYIDVMLVLLVIFMITAPLLNIGVDIDLPQADANSLEAKDDPITVVVAKDGSVSLKLPEQDPQRMDLPELGLRLRALHDANPELAVFVGGDRSASYGAIYEAMGYVQAAGVNKVSLMGDQPGAK